MRSHVAVVRDWVWIIPRMVSDFKSYPYENNPAVHGSRQLFYFTNLERSEF